MSEVADRIVVAPIAEELAALDRCRDAARTALAG
jgi:hypothetical protein